MEDTADAFRIVRSGRAATSRSVVKSRFVVESRLVVKSRSVIKSRPVIKSQSVIKMAVGGHIAAEAIQAGAAGLARERGKGVGE